MDCQKNSTRLERMSGKQYVKKKHLLLRLYKRDSIKN